MVFPCNNTTKSLERTIYSMEENGVLEGVFFLRGFGIRYIESLADLLLKVARKVRGWESRSSLST